MSATKRKNTNNVYKLDTNIKKLKRSKEKGLTV